MDGGTFRLTYPVCLCKKKNLFWKSNVNVHIFFRSDINICSMNILLQRHDMDTERGSISGNVIKALADYLVPFFLQNQWNSSFEKVLAGDFCGRNLCVAVGSFYYRVDVFICEFSEWKFKRSSSSSSSRIGVGDPADNHFRSGHRAALPRGSRENHKLGCPYLRQGRSKQGGTSKSTNNLLYVSSPS